METAIAEEIENAIAFAESGPWEPVEDLLKDVLTLEHGKAWKCEIKILGKWAQD